MHGRESGEKEVRGGGGGDIFLISHLARKFGNLILSYAFPFQPRNDIIMFNLGKDPDLKIAKLRKYFFSSPIFFGVNAIHKINLQQTH